MCIKSLYLSNSAIAYYYHAFIGIKHKKEETVFESSNFTNSKLQWKWMLLRPKNAIGCKPEAEKKQKNNPTFNW